MLHPRLGLQKPMLQVLLWLLVLRPRCLQASDQLPQQVQHLLLLLLLLLLLRGRQRVGLRMRSHPQLLQGRQLLQLSLQRSSAKLAGFIRSQTAVQ